MNHKTFLEINKPQICLEAENMKQHNLPNHVQEIKNQITTVTWKIRKTSPSYNKKKVTLILNAINFVII